MLPAGRPTIIALLLELCRTFDRLGNTGGGRKQWAVRKESVAARNKTVPALVMMADVLPHVAVESVEVVRGGPGAQKDMQQRDRVCQIEQILAPRRLHPTISVFCIIFVVFSALFGLILCRPARSRSINNPFDLPLFSPERIRTTYSSRRGGARDCTGRGGWAKLWTFFREKLCTNTYEIVPTAVASNCRLNLGVYVSGVRGGRLMTERRTLSMGSFH